MSNRGEIKAHTEEWFAAQEARISEPIQNTVRYYRKPFYISAILYIATFFLTFDYYGAARGFLRLRNWLDVLPLESLYVLGIYVIWHGLQALWLALTLRRLERLGRYTTFAILYHVFSLPIFGILSFTAKKSYAIYALVSVIAYGLRIIAFFILKKHIRNGFECRYYLGVFTAQSANYLDKGRSVTLCGAPGTGKTVLGGTMSKILAEQRWEKLTFDYLTENARKEYYVQTLNVEKLKRLQALEESYLFYKSREQTHIPCLVTTIGMQDLNGRYSYVLEAEMYAQLKRVPEYSVLFNDESGREQGCETSKNAGENVKDFWRLNRHFGDFILINTEQGVDGNGKFIRKCTDYNLHCYYQEWLLPPKRLQAKFEKRKLKFNEKVAEGKLTEEEQRYILQELYYESKYIATIGFRKIKVKKEGTTEQTGMSFNDEEGYKIIPSRTIYNYDERAYAELYRCGEEEIKLEGWTSLTLNSRIVGDDTKTDVIIAND